MFVRHRRRGRPKNPKAIVTYKNKDFVKRLKKVTRNVEGIEHPGCLIPIEKPKPIDVKKAKEERRRKLRELKRKALERRKLLNQRFAEYQEGLFLRNKWRQLRRKILKENRKFEKQAKRLLKKNAEILVELGFKTAEIIIESDRHDDTKVNRFILLDDHKVTLLELKHLKSFVNALFDAYPTVQLTKEEFIKYLREWIKLMELSHGPSSQNGQEVRNRDG